MKALTVRELIAVLSKVDGSLPVYGWIDESENGVGYDVVGADVEHVTRSTLPTDDLGLHFGKSDESHRAAVLIITSKL